MNFITDLSPRLTSTPLPSGFNKYEFPSKKTVQIDWHKLASVDLHELNSGKCNAEILQDHLNHIAFCQPEAEIHVENAAGQRNILKMFRLAQLIIQYLFISQDYMESQLNHSKKEHQLMLEKYNEMKAKLKEQIEEARKIKKSNKSLTDSVVYLNSVLSSMGAIDHYRCPLCPKAFRSKDYLVSHLQRKHPQHSNSVNIDNCFVQSSTNNTKDANVLNAVQFTPTSFGHQTSNQFQGISNQQLNDTQTMQPNQFYINKVPFKQSISLFDQPSTSITQSHTGYFIENNNIEGLNALPVSHRECDSVSGNITQGFQANIHGIPKSNDIDVYKVNEMQKSFNVMNDIVLKLTKDLEDQKKLMKEQFASRQKELAEKVEEKYSMQNTYETMIKKLGDKMEILQSRQNENFEEDKEKLLHLIEHQKEEIMDLKKSVKNEKPTKKILHTEKTNEKLKSEMQKLKEEIKYIQETHALNIQMTEEKFKADFEVKLKHEIENSKRQLERTKQSNVTEKEMTKPQITKVKKKKTKPTAVNEERIRKEGISKDIKIKEYEQTSASETDETSRWYPAEKKYERENREIDEDEKNPDNEDQEDGLESLNDTDEEYFKSSRMHTNDKTSHRKETLPKNNIMYSSEDEDSENKSMEVLSNDEANLKELTERNPNLWYQMKEVINEELTRRLNQFNIDEKESGISNRDLRSHLLHLIRMRKPLTEKYKEFTKLRKSIEREVEEKIQKRTITASKDINSVESNTMEDKDRIKSKSFSKSFKRLASKMKFRAKPFQKSREVRSADINEEITTGKDLSSADEEVENKGDEDEEEKGEDDNDDDEEEEKTEEDSSIYSSTNEIARKTQVDIHNETKRSVRRNLFPGSPLSTSPNYPRTQNVVINNTYGNISEEEWDTESSDSSVKSTHEYENVKSVRSLPSNNYFSQPGTSSVEIDNENQEIKLKKPSGPMVTKLSAKIEHQLRNRSSRKLPGSIDITGNKNTQKEGSINDDIQEIESISISE